MIDTEDLKKIEQQLGRSPRGVKEVICYNHLGWPRVVRVSPIVAGKPFPSHYWLTCQILKKEIDHIEAKGWVKKLENEILVDDLDFRDKVMKDHERYRDERISLLKQEGLFESLDPKFIDSLTKRGVGGVQDFTRVRCFHMHYAHHLAKGNTIGKYLDDTFHLNKL